MRVGIIGAGVVGNKRAQSILSASQGDEIILVCDTDPSRAQDLAKRCGAEACQDWRDVVGQTQVETVVVATPNRYLCEVSLAALDHGQNVLCEKPLGMNAQESHRIWRRAEKSQGTLKTGFNHRHHPAVRAAKGLTDQGEIGDIYFAKCSYGHGGRPGYEKEWRASKNLCGGGELLDQGVHVVDLFRWFLGDFDEAFGWTRTYHWQMDVEDNAFALFKKEPGQTAAMHTSWTQWRNRFSFEVYGSLGYLIIRGLGGSYGTETLTVGRKVGLGKPPEETVEEFPGPDTSWINEWKELRAAIEEKREPLGSGYDGLMANRMIEAVYQSARKNRPVKIARE